MIIDERYELLVEVGAGATAEVWKARDLLGDFVCAVKLMSITKTCFDLCAEEFKILSHLYHPNIIRTYDMGYVESLNQSYLSMEYLSGKSWKDVGRASPDKVVQWVEQLVSVLRYLHSPRIRVVHKDIKPGNIVVEGDRAVLIDFNIAGRQAAHLGTPAYKCPTVEQEGLGWTPYADVWALAVSVYELVTEHDLFGDKQSPSFDAKLRTKPIIPIPTKMYKALCAIIAGGGRQVQVEGYSELFALPGRRYAAVEIPSIVLKSFKVTSPKQQFIIKAMLAQIDPSRPRSKDVIVREALTRVSLPCTLSQKQGLRAVFSQLKKLGVVVYSGPGNARATLTGNFLAAISEFNSEQASESGAKRA